MNIVIRIIVMLVVAFIFHIIFNKINIHEQLVSKYKLGGFIRNTLFHIIAYFSLAFAAIAIEYYVRSGASKTTYSDIFVGGIIIASMIKTIDVAKAQQIAQKKQNRPKTRHKKKKKKR